MSSMSSQLVLLFQNFVWKYEHFTSIYCGGLIVDSKNHCTDPIEASNEQKTCQLLLRQSTAWGALQCSMYYSKMNQKAVVNEAINGKWEVLPAVFMFCILQKINKSLKYFKTVIFVLLMFGNYVDASGAPCWPTKFTNKFHKNVSVQKSVLVERNRQIYIIGYCRKPTRRVHSYRPTV
jgi:hypothetical protein